MAGQRWALKGDAFTELLFRVYGYLTVSLRIVDGRTYEELAFYKSTSANA